MDISVIAEAFVVTVVGGMGSVPGAFLAALLIGRAAGLRHPDLPQDHAGAGVPADGAGAGGAAVGPDGPARGRARPAWCCRRASCGSQRFGRAEHIAVGAAGADAAGAAAGRRRLPRQGGHRGAVLRAGRLQPELPDRRRRHRQLRPCRLLRPRRLRCGADGDEARAAHGAGAAGRSRGRRARRGAVRLLRRAPDGHLPRHADAGVRADHLCRRLPMGGGDGRRQRRGRRVAVALGVGPHGLLLPGAVP